jgi:hypothetical protein
LNVHDGLRLRLGSLDHVGRLAVARGVRVASPAGVALGPRVKGLDLSLIHNRTHLLVGFYEVLGLSL